MTIDQLKRAAIAKLSSKKDMPEWYYQRMEICGGCPKNSGNVDKISFVDRVRISHNFGKDSCLVCSCGTSDLASDPQEHCKDKPSRWKAVETILQSSSQTVENKSPEKATILREGVYYNIDYGTLQFNSDSIVEIHITIESAKDMKASSSCGCTVPKVVKEGNIYKLKIKYDTTRVGDINGKTVRLKYNKNNINSQRVIC